MNRLTRYLMSTLTGAALLMPLTVAAQHRGGNSASRPGGTTQSARPSQSSTRPSQSSARPSQSSTRPQQNISRPTQSTKPGNNGVGQATRPGNNGNPGNGSLGNNSHNNGGNHNNNAINPGVGNHNNGNHNNGNHNNGNHNNGNHNNHGTSATRPGYQGPGNIGHQPSQPGVRPGGGNSAPKPGAWAGASRPHYNYRNPGYRPPRPGGGYWAAPLPNPYRINYWIPPVPRYVRVVHTVPSIGTILGLTFGSFIDAGINSLYNAGYTVNGYYNDGIYLSNVRQLGYLWPEAIVRYNDGLMCGTQFYNWSAVPDQAMYYNLYNQLTASYGTPVDISYSASGPTATWWAGGNTGYITLSYGYGASASGMSNYYTSLTYTAY